MNKTIRQHQTDVLLDQENDLVESTKNSQSKNYAEPTKHFVALIIKNIRVELTKILLIQPNIFECAFGRNSVYSIAFFSQSNSIIYFSKFPKLLYFDELKPN